MFNRRRKTQTVAFSSCGSVYWAPLEHERHTGKSHVLTRGHHGQSTAGAALPSDTDSSNSRAQGKPPCSQDATHDDHPASTWSDSSKHIPFCTYQHTSYSTGSTTYDALACCALLWPQSGKIGAYIKHRKARNSSTCALPKGGLLEAPVFLEDMI